MVMAAPPWQTQVFHRVPDDLIFHDPFGLVVRPDRMDRTALQLRQSGDVRQQSLLCR
jgi:hypothetical protein